MTLNCRIYFNPEVQINSWEFLDLISQLDEDWLEELEREYDPEYRCELNTIISLRDCLNNIIDAHEKAKN